MRRSLAIALMGASIGCGQPRSPATEDACARDEDCAGALMCCHVTNDAPSGARERTADRGFCVKQSVCANVVPPRQAPPLEE